MLVIIYDSREGLHGWGSGSAMELLASGNMVRSRHEAKRIKRMTGRVPSAKVSFGGVRIRHYPCNEHDPPSFRQIQALAIFSSK